MIFTANISIPVFLACNPIETGGKSKALPHAIGTAGFVTGKWL